MSKLILALDISSVKTGYAILNEYKDIIEAGYLKMDKENKSTQLYMWITELFLNFNIEYCVIEDIFLGPNPTTYKNLAGLHGVAKLALDMVLCKFELIGASSARKKVLNDGSLKKEQVYEKIQAMYLQHNLKTKGFDVSDAVLIALAYSGYDLEPNLVKELTELVEKITKTPGA